MRQKAPQWLAPSTSAASSSSTRQIEEGLAQDDHDEGQDEGGVDQDQRQMRVEQAQRAHGEVEGDDGGDRRQDALRQEPDGDVAVLPALEAEPGDGVGRGRAERQRQEGRRDRDHGAVEQGAARSRACRAGHPVAERRLEIDPGDAEAGDGEGVERIAQATARTPSRSGRRTGARRRPRAATATAVAEARAPLRGRRRLSHRSPSSAGRRG